MSLPDVTATSFIGMSVLAGTLSERQPNATLVEAELHVPDRTFFTIYRAALPASLVVGLILTAGHFLLAWNPRSSQGGHLACDSCR